MHYPKALLTVEQACNLKEEKKVCKKNILPDEDLLYTEHELLDKLLQ